MPTEISASAALVWLAVGFFTGFGWGVGTWLAGWLLALTVRRVP